MKKGLVLEGGAYRGLFTAGILDVMMEHGIQYDGAIGVSAGAAFGVNYKSQQIGRVIRYNKRFAKDPRYASMASYFKTGNFYNAEFCYHTVPMELDVFDRETYRNNPMEFWCVATKLKDAKAIYYRLDDVDYEGLEWIRASCALPLLSKPVEIGRYRLWDGGIVDPIPYRFMMNKGYDKLVVVLTQPLGYSKNKMKGIERMKGLFKDEPAIYEALKTRHIDYNKDLALLRRLEKTGEIFVLRPTLPLHISKMEHDPLVMEEVYQEGRRVMMDNLQQLQAYLEK